MRQAAEKEPVSSILLCFNRIRIGSRRNLGHPPPGVPRGEPERRSGRIRPAGSGYSDLSLHHAAISRRFFERAHRPSAKTP